MFKTHVFAATALVLGLGGFSTADDLADNAKARAAAAGKAYETAWKRLMEDSDSAPGVDALYQWSRRWMEAEQEASDKKEEKVAAAQAHLERMKKLEQVVKLQYDVGKLRAGDAAGAEYYRLEAERQVLLAKGR